MTSQVFLGLGSNLDDPVAQLQGALDDIAAHAQLTLGKCSHFYASSPMGPQDQPDYVNAVCQISTSLAPHDLLQVTQGIENKHHRTRNNERWGPRTLDIDILLYDDLRLQSDDLVIPHYGMQTREFVLVPLFEIAPDLSMHDGSELAAWVAKCSLQGLYRLDYPREYLRRA